MATQGQQRLSDPTQQPVSYDVVDEDNHTQNANDIRPFEKRFVMYHRAILYAFVALLLVTVSVLITYAVTKAGDTAATTNTSEQAISMPSFMTELSTIKTIESGLYESCGTEDFFYTDAEGTCCSGTNFVYWDEQFLCCEGDVLSDISAAGLTCSTAESVMSSGDECSCPSESVAGPCIEDYDGFCCEFQELIYTATPDGDEQWLCCGLDTECVMEYSVLAPVPVTDSFDSSVVYFTPDALVVAPSSPVFSVDILPDRLPEPLVEHQADSGGGRIHPEPVVDLGEVVRWFGHKVLQAYLHGLVAKVGHICLPVLVHLEIVPH